MYIFFESVHSILASLTFPFSLSPACHSPIRLHSFFYVYFVLVHNIFIFILRIDRHCSRTCCSQKYIKNSDSWSGLHIIYVSVFVFVNMIWISIFADSFTPHLFCALILNPLMQSHQIMAKRLENWWRAFHGNASSYANILPPSK